MRVLAVLFSFVLPAAGNALVAVNPLKWTDPQGRRPMSYSTWQAGHESELDGAGIGTVSRAGFVNVVDVVVNAELYPSITAELAQYESDLVAAGYSVQVDTTRGMSHAALRSHLAGVSQIVGAVFVGELPVAWYEMDGEEFPADIYFMDLNGTWVDADHDGLYEGHTGDVNLEIWVGRLYARPLTWDDEVRLTRRYFAKNHAYRTGQLSLPDQALSYVDDDWSGFGDCYLSQLYPSVTTVNQGSTTRASDYRIRLTQGYEWIQVCAHSSPWGHTFKVGSGFGGTVFNCEIYAIRPHAHFYNLFACSGTRFVEENYSAGWDIFQDEYGLCAVGSAKTGSMIGYFNDFYRPMAHDSCIGTAFKGWYAMHGESDRFWHYGLNILGDPTLKPRGQTGRYAAEEPPAPLGPTTAEVVCTDPETDDCVSALAMPDGKVWALWRSGRSTTNGRFDIYASVRSGGAWSSAYSVGNAYYWETDPCLGIDRNNRPVAVWSLFTDAYYYNLYYSVWNGTSWSAGQPVSDDPSSDMAASLARDSTGTLWCAFMSRRDEFCDVFVTSFNGTSWTTPSNVTHDSVIQLHPKATVMPDGTVWIAYTEYRNGAAVIRARYKSGADWVETGVVSGTQSRAYRPAIAPGAAGRPVVSWQSFDAGNGDVCYSEYDGAGWPTPTPVGADSALDVMPAMAVDAQQRPWVVWMSERSGEWDAFCSHYELGQWSPAQVVTADAGPDMNPAICCAASSDVWVLWQNLTAGNWDIHAQLAPLTGVAEAHELGRGRLLVQPDPSRAPVQVSSADRLISVSISDVAGRLVARLVPSGRRLQVTWNGRDDAGRSVPPGVYVVRARTSAGVLARKLLRVR